MAEQDNDTAAAAPDAAPALPRPKILKRSLPVAAPPLVPARMVNEVLYCERLAYLEWAQGEFADNHFTVDGRHTHRRADTPGGQLPPTASVSAAGASSADADVDAAGDSATVADDTSGRPYVARSVWLSSERLGLTAKIDIVEGAADGTVVPIDYKRGAAPDHAQGAYLPERAQVCAQALLLREHGYRCDEGALYFAKSRRRVAVPIDQRLIDHTLWAVRRLRTIAQEMLPPPPLDDSPKCPGCSLNGICLPDEVNLLKRLNGESEPDPEPDQLTGPLDPDPWGLVGLPADDLPVPGGRDSTRHRRLQPARDDRVPVYVMGHRSSVGLSGERLVLRGEGGATHARLMNTSQLVIYGNAQISVQALRALLERNVPVSFFSGGGWFVGRASGHSSKNVELRLAQYAAATDAQRCVAIARALVGSKIRNCRTLLRRNHSQPEEVVLGQLKQLARKAAAAESLESLLGIEGAAARVYFQAFAGMLKAADPLGAFDFEGRNRRPPRDPVNALLSLCYALLTKEVTNTLSAVGFDPLLGFYHQPRFGRPALALDLMEELRPLVADSVVIGVVNTAVVGPRDFVHGGGACTLTDAARRKVIGAFERRMDQVITHPLFQYPVSYRRVVEVQARLLGRVLTGELERYPTFGTR